MPFGSRHPVKVCVIFNERCTSEHQNDPQSSLKMQSTYHQNPRMFTCFVNSYRIQIRSLRLRDFHRQKWQCSHFSSIETVLALFLSKKIRPPFDQTWREYKKIQGTEFLFWESVICSRFYALIKCYKSVLQVG